MRGISHVNAPANPYPPNIILDIQLALYIFISNYFLKDFASGDYKMGLKPKPVAKNPRGTPKR